MEVNGQKVILRLSDYFCDSFGGIVKENMPSGELSVNGFLEINKHFGQCAKCRKGIQYISKDIVSLRKMLGNLVKEQAKEKESV